ncbi:putative RNA-directed DNA polymerase [Helianthus annuus]|nr:putative RNA-directed DNA polymerase [Helianthus annuus]
MNFLTLNLRGVSDSDKAVWVRDLKRVSKFSFLGIQETHQEGLLEDWCSRFWDRGPLAMDMVDAIGRSGGLLSMWDPNILAVDSVAKHRHFLLVSGCIKGVEERINILNIHAPNDQVVRRRLWDEFLELKASNPGMWVALGDFNDVRNEGERVNSSFDPYATAFFNDFISRAGLLEYRMLGGQYTYISDNEEIKLSKLDRIFVCDLFMSKWPGASLSVLKKGASDHCPVSLMCFVCDFGPTPFKLYNSWVGTKELNNIVEANLKGEMHGENNDTILAILLKRIKGDIKKWTSIARFEEDKELATLYKIAEELEMVAESATLKYGEKKLKVGVRQKIKSMEKAKVKDLHQKSRLKWIKYGDENTSFFHGIINTKKASNRLKGLNINGVWVIDPHVIKEELRKWFKKQFSEPIR